MKGQASIELISYIGLFMLIASALTMYSYPQWIAQNKVGKAEIALKDLKNTVENVYGFGPGRRQTVTIKLPSDIVYAQAKDNRFIMQLQMSEKHTTDVVEAVDAPIIGTLPTTEGTHQITVEYSDSGFIIIGQTITINPNYQLIETTPTNQTNITYTLSNIGEKNLDITLNSDSWVTLNETHFNLINNTEKKVYAEISVPSDAKKIFYEKYVTATATNALVSAKIILDVGGEFCGDGIVDLLEECDTINSHCINEESLVCDTDNTRYKVYPEFGVCTNECKCEYIEPEWIICGDGCTDPNYCNNCNHQSDGKNNCGGVGGCNLCKSGETRSCGGSECLGIQTCVLGCGWSDCTTYGLDCSESKCCICGGTPSNPQKTFDETQNNDCTGKIIECGQPQTCTGGTYGLMCTGINECSKDLNGIYTPINYSSKACLGVECEPPEYMCVDQIYPCHGIFQLKVCDKEAQCISKDYADDRVCAGITECIAPKEIILSKMDYNSREYVDAPQSFWGWMGGKKDGTCEGESAYYTFKEVHNTDYGAYAPYNESILSFYAKAHYIYDDNRQTKENCAYICGCGIRIGFDEQNYIEYEAPCPTLMYWTKYTIDLKNKPIDSKGLVDWNQIKYFRLRFGAAQMLCNRCSPCYGNIDYITLER